MNREDFSVITVIISKNWESYNFICQRCKRHLVRNEKVRFVSSIYGYPLFEDQWICKECTPTDKDAIEYAYVKNLTKLL